MTCIRPIPRRDVFFLAVAGLLAFGTAGFPARSADSGSTSSPAEERLRADVTYLADDEREGRAPGTKGIEAAADYIASVFRESGLKPAPGAEGYFQPFSIRGTAELGKDPKLSITPAKGSAMEVKPKTEFSPLSLGSSAKVKDLPIVFAGYGITAKNEAAKLDYDDYKDLDVKGKAVLIIRREPRQNDPASPFDGVQPSRFADLRHKVTNAFQHGAAAIVLVNDSLSSKDGKDELLPINYAGGEMNSEIPFVMISRSVANAALAASGLPDVDGLEKEIDKELKPKSRPVEGAKLSATYDLERKGIKTKNVIGVLEGSGPLADETIVVGAHYDHLGKGGFMSGSLAFMSSDIHNGADDNASGTSLMMELARRLSKRTDPLPRRIVFMAFSGEEKGLLGSAHYVRAPLFPLGKTVMMLNFDMVGRLNKNDELTLFGLGSTPGAPELVDALGKSAGFKIKKVTGMSDGIGGSDHQSFYNRDIPVMFAFTGTHTDYHRPGDDSNKINYAGMARIADFGELLLLDIARRPKRPEFTKAASRMAAGHGAPPATPAAAPAGREGGQSDPARGGIRAYLGSIPDYDEGSKGVKLSGVTEGSPAEKAGLKSGDVVIGFGGKPVVTIYDYTESLGQHKPGEKVDVKVKRGDKELTLPVTLGARPRGN